MTGKNPTDTPDNNIDATGKTAATKSTLTSADAAVDTSETTAVGTPDTSLFAGHPLIKDMDAVRTNVVLELADQARVEVASLAELHALNKLLEGGPVTKEALSKAIATYQTEIMTGTNIIARLLKVIMLITQNFGQNTANIIVPGNSAPEAVSLDGLNRAVEYLNFAARQLQTASGTLTQHQARLATRPAGSLISIANLSDMAATANAERGTSGPTHVVVESDAEAAKYDEMKRETGVKLTITRPQISQQALEKAIDELIKVLSSYNGIRAAARGHIAATEMAAIARALGRRGDIIQEEPSMAADPTLVGKVQEIISRVPEILGVLAIWLEKFIGPQQHLLASKLAVILAFLEGDTREPQGGRALQGGPRGALVKTRRALLAEFLRNHDPSISD